MNIRIEADEINKVSFSLSGPSHMVIYANLTEEQIKYILSQTWEYVGDEFFKKYFEAEGYDFKEKKS